MTVVAAGYFVVTNRSGASGTPQDFTHTAQRVVQEARSLPTMASKVQRFLELHTFHQNAIQAIGAMQRDVARLHQIASGSSGNDKTIADQAATVGDQALDAATRYEEAVALTYRLNNASTAEQDLNTAIANLQQQVQAWAHR